jgi:hypothetical protein
VVVDRELDRRGRQLLDLPLEVGDPALEVPDALAPQVEVLDELVDRDGRDAGNWRYLHQIINYRS